jgi:HEAT repeat protein
VASTPVVLERLVALTADPDNDVRRVVVGALGALGTEAATPIVLERLVALTADSDSRVRRAAAGALGALGMEAATPVVLERLVELIADEDGGVRQAAVGALGALEAGVALPIVLERLVALTADPDRGVRRAAAGALDRMRVPEGFEEFLGQFWQAYLVNSESGLIGNQYGRVCDIAYRQLQQIAARMAAQHGDRRDGSRYLISGSIGHS